MEIDIADSIDEIEPMIFMKMLMSVGESRLRAVPKNAVTVSQMTRMAVTILVGDASRTTLTVGTAVNVCAQVILNTGNVMSLTGDPNMSSERGRAGLILSSRSAVTPVRSSVTSASVL